MPSILRCISLVGSGLQVEQQPSSISLLFMSFDNLPLRLSKANRLLLKEQGSGSARILIRRDIFSLPLKVEFFL